MKHETFAWFDPHRVVRVYHRNLPHWRQDGALYFVTFRLADSIPHRVLAAWAQERKIWLRAHGIVSESGGHVSVAQLSEKDQRAYARMNARRLFGELDRGWGRCDLRRGDVREILKTSLLFHDATRWQVGDFVIMPNHVHLLVFMLGNYELEKQLNSVKRFSARRINGLLGREGALWQRESYDHIVRDCAELRRIRRYIRLNPGKASLSREKYSVYEAAWLNRLVPESVPENV